MKRALALALLVVLSGCGSPEQRWLEWVASVHRDADAHLAAKDLINARDRLEQLLRPAPEGVPAETVREIQMDAAFRLALSGLEEVPPSEALRYADQGLALGKRDDLFTANLLIVHGRASELLGDDKAAVADYAEASRINERLLRAATESSP